MSRLSVVLHSTLPPGVAAWVCSIPNLVIQAPADDAGATTAADPVPDVANTLQGKWQAVDDPKTVFAVKGSALTTYYDGQKRLTNTFAYVADCGGNACSGQKSKYGCFTTAGKFDIDCQSIINLSATELEVTQGVSGKTIRYRRPQ